ncbi:MAG: hypothetical protein IJ158_12670 [Treponema sp.]|nr:hypothetical protein [Treponema sp.]
MTYAELNQPLTSLIVIDASVGISAASGFVSVPVASSPPFVISSSSPEGDGVGVGVGSGSGIISISSLVVSVELFFSSSVRFLYAETVYTEIAAFPDYTVPTFT